MPIESPLRKESRSVVLVLSDMFDDLSGAALQLDVCMSCLSCEWCIYVIGLHCTRILNLTKKLLQKLIHFLEQITIDDFLCRLF